MQENHKQTRKACIVCGRPMITRRKWALGWQGVKYCSDRCRREHKKLAGDQVAG